MSRSLSELAELVGATVVGDGEATVSDADSLESAGPRAISFFADRRLRDALAVSQAGAVLLSAKDRDAFTGNRLLVDNPYTAYARIAQLLHPESTASAGVATSANIDPRAKVSDGAEIGANAVIAAGAHIADGVVIAPGVVIGENVHIGAETHVGANAVIGGRATVGTRCRIAAGVIIGESGFGFAPSESGWVGIPQRGSVVIGDDVEIGACTSIDRGTSQDTRLGNGVKLDNQIQVGHNVSIGDDSIVAACVGIAGSATIGQRCMIAGKSAIRDHVNITDDVVIEAASVVLQSIDQPGRYSSVITVQEAGRWKRNSAILRKLDELLARVRKLERD